MAYEKTGNPQPFEEWLIEQLQKSDNKESK